MNSDELISQGRTHPENAASLAAPLARQPIVILGGFLSWGALYGQMGRALHELAGVPVYIVPIASADWWPSMRLAGWSRLLQKLDRSVHEAVSASKTGKVTLVGHSAGGIVGRLYLSSEPFEGHAYGGLDYVNLLITLGSPHYTLRGGLNRRWVEMHYPGAYYYPDVNYVSIAGRAILGSAGGSLLARFAAQAYRRLCGEGETWGDGLVPVASALLEGSHQVTLSGICHYSISGRPWYGTPEAVAKWWTASIAFSDSPDPVHPNAQVIRTGRSE